LLQPISLILLQLNTHVQKNSDISLSNLYNINKAHPELHCDGQCFLAKKLKDLDGKNKQAQENLKRVVEAEPGFKLVVLNHTIPFFVIKSESGYLEKPVKDLSIAIFHPPKTV